MMPTREDEAPLTRDAPRIVARLRFADRETPDSGGELRLLSDACFVFAPSPLLHDRLTHILSRADSLSLSWGVTALYGLAAVGAALWYGDKRNAAGTAFVAAGSVGALGAAIRGGARQIASGLERPRPLSEIRLHPGNDGGMTVGLFGRRLNKILFTIRPDEFDPDEAEAFVRAVEAAKGQK